METTTDTTYEYQLWQQRPGEYPTPPTAFYAVQMRPYQPAEDQRYDSGFDVLKLGLGTTTGSLEDQRYERTLIVRVCGPLYASAGHDPITEGDVAALSYEDRYVDWLREHADEFSRVDALDTVSCLLCGEVHAASDWTPTHDIKHYGQVQLVDEGTEDGSSGAYTAEEMRGNDWPRVRRMADGRWLDGDAEDISHRVRAL